MRRGKFEFNMIPRQFAAACRAIAVLVLLLQAVPGWAAPSLEECRNQIAQLPRAYVPVLFSEDGSILPADLDGVIQRLRERGVDRSTHVVVLVHGFNADCGVVARDYDRIARYLQKSDAAHVGRFVLVGVHWPSDPGPLQDWLPKMAAYRFTTGLGFPSPVANPYREKSRIAGIVGRRGLRTLLFRIQDAFPGAPTHLWAHSMGSECAIRALAPSTLSRGETPGLIEEPERALHVSSVVLAGADLDQDVFTLRSRSNAREALDHADLWWVTVARANSADAALEVRRGAGRKDAVGNVGLALDRAELRGLVGRCGLILDDEEIPIFHEMKIYFDDARLKRLRRSLEYLRDPSAPGTRGALLETLHRIERAGAGDPPDDASSDQITVRIYRRLKLGKNLSRTSPVRVIREPREPAVKEDTPAEESVRGGALPGARGSRLLCADAQCGATHLGRCW